MLCPRSSMHAHVRLFSLRLPPSVEGEWWELADESRGGLPYYYHTKTHATVWDRPEGFVIPLGILQVRHFPSDRPILVLTPPVSEIGCRQTSLMVTFEWRQHLKWVHGGHLVHNSQDNCYTVCVWHTLPLQVTRPYRIRAVRP
jgi:hypothetical protein